ncbi:MAG: hypothetical protein AB8G99_08885 [Planctomycetaceae bacterium]
MQGLKSKQQRRNSDWNNQPESMLADSECLNADLIQQVVDWFEQVSLNEDQSYEAAIKSKYDQQAARLYRKLRNHNPKNDDGDSLLAKTLDWLEDTAREQQNCDCLEDAIEGVFDEQVLKIYIDIRHARGEFDDGPKVESLTLTSAGLKLRDGALQKLGSEKGTVVASFPLESLNGVWFRKSWNIAMPIFWMAFLSTLAGISKASVPYEWLGWVTAASFGAGAAYQLLCLRNSTIVVDTDHGIVEYPSTDSRADIESFVLAARQQKEMAAE